ncbi:MAG: biopolymer transporter ExbD [Vampirovibrionales bacterium]|nr:biopolymer transporter ExbD [Vampirovibrionales bacterium]
MKAQRVQTFSDINITPLTDIFLVLLIIMMVVAPMLNYSGIKLAVPTVGEASTQTEAPKTITLAINPAGEFTIDDKATPSFQLAVELRKLKLDKPDGVMIQADPKASHEALTRAMDAAQLAGITKVAVSLKQAASE